MNESLEKSFELLLNDFWITKDFNRDEYYYLKQRSKEIKEFVNKNLGNKLIIHDRFIKLEKIPSIPMESGGIKVFTDTLDYVLFFLMLLYLEDKARGERFMISGITDYLKSTAITLELTHIPDWTIGTHRKSLLRVLTYLVEIHVLILNDREKQSFEDTEKADALYEVTGISNYVIPTFYQNIEELNQKEDFLSQEWLGQTEEKGDVRRYKVYRHLLYEPATPKLYWTETEEDYLKKIHNGIKKEIRESLGYDVEITKNLAMIYAEETNSEKNYFPNTKKISDIILLVNTHTIAYQKEKNIKLDERECFELPKEDFYKLLENLRNEKKDYFSKAILDLGSTKYITEIIETMKDYCFLKENEKTFTFFPTIYRFLGKSREKKQEENYTILRMEELDND